MAYLSEDIANPLLLDDLPDVYRLETNNRVYGGKYTTGEYDEGISNLQAMQLMERDNYILRRIGAAAETGLYGKPGIASLDTSGKVPKTQLPTDEVYTEATQTLKNKTIDAKDNTILNTPTWYAIDKTLNSSDLTKEIAIGLNPSTDKVLTIDSSAQAPYLNYKLPITSSTDHSFVRFNSVWNKDVILFLQGGQLIELTYAYNKQWVINEGVSFYLGAAKSIDGVEVNDWRKVTCKGTTSYFYSYTGAASDYDLPSDNCCVEVTWNREGPNAAIAKAIKWESGVKTVWIKSMQSGGWDSSWTEITSNNGTQELTNKTINAGDNTLPNITNCITKIPQDINLTLSSGTLTLKSGSKVYVPNGVNTFDVVTLDTDKTLTITDNAKQMICVQGEGSGKGNLLVRRLSNCVSGAGATTTAGFAYNTTTNQIRGYNAEGTDFGVNYSFPIAIVTVSGGAISSIDQVFNGMGFIGKKAFVLPGVKYLVPNGRNSDGTLKNIDKTTASVSVSTNEQSNWNRVYLLSSGAIDRVNNYIYNENLNLHHLTNDDTAYRYVVYAGTVSLDSSDKIINFEPRTIFHAVDYNDWQRHIGSGEIHTVTTFESGFSPGVLYWSVVNRICYVSFQNIVAASTGNAQAVYTSLPQSKQLMWGSMYDNRGGYYISMGYSTLYFNVTTANSNLQGGFSYPVADDWVES